MRGVPHAATSTGGIPKPSCFDGYANAVVYRVGGSASLTPWTAWTSMPCRCVSRLLTQTTARASASCLCPYPPDLALSVASSW